MKKIFLKLILIFSILVCLITYRHDIYGFVFSDRYRQRLINQLETYDFPDQNNGWTKYSNNPIFGDKETNSVFDPYVYKDGNKFVMILSERRYNSIIRVESFDGKVWCTNKTLLKCIPGTWEHYVNRACVLKKDSIYHMWYTGQSPEISKIGHATSRDGIYFKRDKTNPVVEPTCAEEGISVMNPCVLYNEKRGIFQMWYAAGENYEPDMLFYAESIDGQNWQKLKTPILRKNRYHIWEQSKVGGCDVRLLSDSLYIMYYIGYQNVDVARICYAVSNDGIIWQQPDSNLVISPTKGSWDCDAVYKPSYMIIGDQEFIWYNGRKRSTERIGLITRKFILSNYERKR